MTLYITSCHPLISRNIIATDILGMLTKDGFDIVLIVPTAKKDFFQRTYGMHSGIRVESVATHASRRERIMKFMSLTALNTATLRIKRQTEMRGRGQLAAHILSSNLAHRLIRLIERWTYTHPAMAEVFDRLPPSAVFATDIQSELDVAMLNEARKRSVKTIGMVRSWDNLTSKGLIRVIPDLLLVWNDIVRHEALTLHHISPTRISVIGIPHYDKYHTYKFPDKHQLCAKIGIDPSKEIVLMVPIGDRYLTNNTVDTDIVRLLDAILPQKYCILVRLPPGDYVRGLEQRSQMFAKGRVVFDRIANSSSDHIKMTEITADDDDHFATMIHWSSLVVSGPSTAVIDAVYLDKPTIIFAFDGYEERPYLESIRRYYDYDNFVPVLSSGGIKPARSREEFESFVTTYLRDPSTDRESRRMLARMEVGYLDGHSIDRLYQVLKRACIS